MPTLFLLALVLMPLGVLRLSDHHRQCGAIVSAGLAAILLVAALHPPVAVLEEEQDDFAPFTAYASPFEGQYTFRRTFRDPSMPFGAYKWVLARNPTCPLLNDTCPAPQEARKAARPPAPPPAQAQAPPPAYRFDDIVRRIPALDNLLWMRDLLNGSQGAEADPPRAPADDSYLDLFLRFNDTVLFSYLWEGAGFYASEGIKLVLGALDYQYTLPIACAACLASYLASTALGTMHRHAADAAVVPYVPAGGVVPDHLPANRLVLAGTFAMMARENVRHIDLRLQY